MYKFNYDGSTMKLHIQNEKYYINEAQRTVTLVADVHVEVPKWLTRTIESSQLPNGFTNDGDWSFTEERQTEITMKHTARCSDDDRWNVEKGKKIAMAALEAKAYRSMARRISRWRKRFSDYTRHVNETFDDFACKCVKAAEHDEQYVRNIS